MEKKKRNQSDLLVALLALAIVVSVGGVALNVALLQSVNAPGVTGRLTDTGTVTLTGAGAAGLQISDSLIAIGSGYVNASCPGDVALIHTTKPASGNNQYAEPYCWINTSAYLNGASPDSHTLINNGSLVVNVSLVVDQNAQDLFCGIGRTCLNSSLAQITVSTEENAEPGSCTSGTQSELALTTSNSNVTQTLCDSLQYKDSQDTLEVAYNLTIPVGVRAGAKTLTVTYEAVAA